MKTSKCSFFTLKGEYYVYEEKNEVKERERHDGKDEKGVKGFIKMMKPTVGYKFGYRNIQLSCFVFRS